MIDQDRLGTNLRKPLFAVDSQGKLAEDDAVWSAGQVMTLIDGVPSCEELCQRIVDEAVAVLERGTSLIARI
jgi:NAD(P)H-dependent flavin oxidoreductase YrpB (nitropropane dioxygenase family)